MCTVTRLEPQLSRLRARTIRVGPEYSSAPVDHGQVEQMRKEILKSLAAPLRRNGRLEGALKLTRLPGRGSTVVHQLVIPHATYSPWWADAEFQATFREVQAFTLVDVYRLYELWTLLEQIKDVEGDVLEVGVWRGGSGCLLARKAQLEGLGPVTVFLCDTFAGVVKAGAQDSEYKGGEHSDTSANIVRGLVGRLGLDNVRVLEGTFPDETGHTIESRPFRLCHIDVDVYDSARDVFEWCWSRLSAGGVVVFDDYGFHDCEGVTRLVRELAARGDVLFVHNLNGHALLIKRPQIDGAQS
jgi:O-methyltransferase